MAKQHVLASIIIASLVFIYSCEEKSQSLGPRITINDIEYNDTFKRNRKVPISLTVNDVSGLLSVSYRMVRVKQGDTVMLGNFVTQGKEEFTLDTFYLHKDTVTTVAYMRVDAADIDGNESNQTVKFVLKK